MAATLFGLLATPGSYLMKVAIVRRMFVVIGVAGVAASALAAPPTSKPSSTLQTTPPKPPTAVKPDLVVRAVWLGQGTGDRFAQLGRNPKVGETVSLVCDPLVVRSVPPGWKIAWYVDGQKKCGEGQFTLTNAPECEFAWPFAEGTPVFIDWVPHQTGTHTYRCAVDVGNAVNEANESNNSKQVSFTVAAAALPTVTPPLAPPAPGAAKPGPFLKLRPPH